MSEKENYLIKELGFQPNIITPEGVARNIFFNPRNPFSHKGNYGHALLVAGSIGKGGAAVLMAHSTLIVGTGLVTVHIPKNLCNILQISIPEAMVDVDEDKNIFSSPIDISKYDVLGIGCGLGTEKETKDALLNLLKTNDKPIVIDADALNLIASMHKDNEGADIFQYLKPYKTILTPHPKEFERLFGKFSSFKAKVEFMHKFSANTNIVVVAKDSITTISDEKGNIYFCTLGNAGMATAGSGDVLAGIITGVLAQMDKKDLSSDKQTSINDNMVCSQSAMIGVMLHALSGDIAAKELGEKSMLASDIIHFLPNAFKDIEVLK